MLIKIDLSINIKYLNYNMINLPSQLSFIPGENRFGHKAGIIKGGKIIAVGESSLSGARHITNGHFGKSCHAEMNACKQLTHYIKGQLPPQTQQIEKVYSN